VPATAPAPELLASPAVFDRVTLRKVTKVYGRHRALAGVDLTLEAGSVCGLLGPNGAGKSTLVGILSTLLRPTAGEVRYGAASHAEAARHVRGDIGVVAHDSFLYGDLSGRENLRLWGRLYGLVDPERRAGELLERVGLTGAAERIVRSYSRGMQQRLAVARALLHAPRLLLLDEPFTGLDASATATLRALIAEEREAGAIILLVTHDLEVAADLCDHLAILRGGAVACDERRPVPGGYQALRDRYHEVVDG
jgi:heme exporter protein A